jgi:20S proteasome alpha/beta subunit
MKGNIMETALKKEEVFELMKKAVSEAFDDKITQLKLSIIPYVSNQEMDEIIEEFGSPDDFIDNDFIEVDF